MTAVGCDAEHHRFADFHALRHTAGSLLAAGQVSPKVAQTLMRHSDINLTMSRYTHSYRGQEIDAVGKLPDFGKPMELPPPAQSEPSSEDKPAGDGKA